MLMSVGRPSLKAVFGTALLLLPGAVHAWTQTADSYGFAVDTSSRNDVVSFWHGVYLKSEGYQNRVGWTGNFISTAAGAEGTVSAAFVADVERRTNFIRALCGVPADVRFNTGATVNIVPGDTYAPAASTTKAAAAQRSALMLVRTAVAGSGLGITHDPPSSCIAWTTAAWNANNKGNLAYAYYGPRAIDAYFREDVSGISSWNLDVGHRRWLLNLQSTDFATGDVSGFRPELNGGTAMPGGNVTYVVPKASELDTSVGKKFVAYPGAGYFPAQLNSPYWSLSYPGANFSTATVTMTGPGGTAVTTNVVSRRTGYGENAIVWQVPTSVSSQSFPVDATYQVTVSGITGTDVPTSHAYSVTLMDPERLTSTSSVSGPSGPTTSGADYSFNRIPSADSMELGFFRVVDATWSEGAEDSPASGIVDLTDPNYELRASVTASSPGVPSNYFRSGSKAFRLSLPTAYEPSIGDVPDQVFELGREIIPGANAALNLYFRRGYMAASTSLVIESSADGGLSWTTRATIAGVSSNTPDSGFTSLAVPLPASSAATRIRFRLTYSSGSLYTAGAQPTLATGIFLDDISVTNCLSLEKRGSIETADPVTIATFDSTTAGEPLADGQLWWLRSRARLGGVWFPYGSPLAVTPQGPLGISGSPTPTDTGAVYTFRQEEGAASYQVEVARLSSASWLEGAEPSPVPKVVDQTGAYALLSSRPYKTGRYSFRLALDSDSDSEDSFEVDRTLAATAGTVLTFQVKRGRMLNTNFVHAEVSSDGGATWTSVWNQAGLGTLLTSSTADRAFVAKSISLSSHAGQDIRVRFVIRKDPAAQTMPASSRTDVGVWIDDIKVTNAPEIVTRTLTDLPAAPQSFTLDALKAPPGLLAGVTYRLRVRGVFDMGGPGSWGQPLAVVPVYSVPIVSWLEGAEASPTPRVLDETGAYDLLSTKFKKTGLRAFRLALDSDPDAIDDFVITRCLIPSPGSALSFKVKRGKMLNSNFLHAEISSDAGSTWTSLWSLPGLGTSLTSTAVDKAFIAYSIPLSAYAAQEVFVRFVFRKDPSAATIPAASKSDAGVWVDDISVNAAGAGTAVLGGSTPALPPSGATAASGFDLWQLQYPSLAGQAFNADSDGDGTPDGVEFAFSLDPTRAQPAADLLQIDATQGRLSISRPLPEVREGILYGAEWTDDLTAWSTDGVVVTTTGGQAVASAPLGSGKRFLRWKITRP